MDRPPADLRNVVLVGHSGAGKTALLHALMAAGPPPARVEQPEPDGAVPPLASPPPASPPPASPQPSSIVTVSSVEMAGTRINLIDTPGHPDLVGGLRAGLSAADAAVFVVSAAQGLDGATAQLWDECASLELPRAVAVTHLDRPGADFEESLAVCRRVFGDGVVPSGLPLFDHAPAHDGAAAHAPTDVQAPTDDGTADDDSTEVVVGLIGLLSMRLSHYGPAGRELLDADPAHHELVENHRAGLVEAIVQESEDDDLLARYLAGQVVPADVLAADLARSVGRGSCHPVLPVTPSGVGTVELLDLIVRGFRPASVRPLPPVTSPDGDPREPLRCDPDGPLVAQVLRTSADPVTERVSLLRVFSGTLRPDSSVRYGSAARRPPAAASGAHSAGAGRVSSRPGTVGLLRRPWGDTALDVCAAGDFCEVTGLDHAAAGDTVCDPAVPLLVESWALPEPVGFEQPDPVFEVEVTTADERPDTMRR